MQFTRNIYDYNWKKLLRWLIPTDLRQSKTLAFVTAAMSALQYLHSQFLIFKQQTEYELTITGQVCYLEKALNDHWDFDQRRITIEDGTFYAPVVLYQEQEEIPVILYQEGEGPPVILYQESETASFESDFVVNLPADIQFDSSEMTAFLKHYCLAGKTFIIRQNG